MLGGNKYPINNNKKINDNAEGVKCLGGYWNITLYEKKTYHEVITEIERKVTHLEPWEKGTHKTKGLNGMCGGVRGVGGGGIVSTAFCILYKLYTLKLTRKQLNGLINVKSSPYVRAIGFMWIRFALKPSNYLEWYEDHLRDKREIDVKAGGGRMLEMGKLLALWLTGATWYDIRFPRVPPNELKRIEYKIHRLQSSSNYHCRNSSDNSSHKNRRRKSGYSHDENDGTISTDDDERDYRKHRSQRSTTTCNNEEKNCCSSSRRNVNSPSSSQRCDNSKKNYSFSDNDDDDDNDDNEEEKKGSLKRSSTSEKNDHSTVKSKKKSIYDYEQLSCW
ncbi:hypothetical protein SNEBB_006386 [Seison nebaliae]|nr:hypothetical protein SNEBB_006386 [Seison nebaliae]